MDDRKGSESVTICHRLKLEANNDKKLKIDYMDKKHIMINLPISIFEKPANAKEYDRLEKILDMLIDEVRGNDKHPLAIAMQIIGENLEQYDNEHFPDIGVA